MKLSRLRRVGPDALAVLAVVGVGVAVLLPALVQGTGIYNNGNSGDFLDTIVPWSNLAWREVHHGTVPLWNPYSVLGLPLSFNWHSATFSLPSLVAYLFPLSFDIPVQLIGTLVIAGTGVYVFCRVLGLRPPASAFAAIAFELSGPIVGWLGLPTGSVMAWAGWLFATAVLVVRGRRRARHVAGFAVVLACTIYDSQPPMLVQLAIALGVFLVIVLAVRLRSPGGRAAVVGAVRDLVLAGGAGLALAAPLILPGLQVIHGSINSLPGVATTNEKVAAVGAIYYLVPADNTYLGAACLVLAVVAVVHRRRRPEVLALGLIAGAAAVVSLAPPALALLHHVPGLKAADWSRAGLLLAFATAVLGGVGAEALASTSVGRSATRWAAAGFAVVGLGILAMVLFGSHHINSSDALFRSKSLLWRGVEAGAGLAVAGAVAASLGRRGAHRARRPRLLQAGRVGAVGTLVLAGCEAAALLMAGQPQWLSSSSSAMPWAPNPAIESFQAFIGPALVGFGHNDNCFPGSPGILQDINVTYKVHEFAVYDRSAPAAYLRAWKAASGHTGYITGGIFCPAVTSDALARRFGVNVVIEPQGAPGPKGGIFEGYAGYSRVFAMPGAYAAVVVPLGPGGRLPGVDAPGSPAKVDYPDYGTWRVQTYSSAPSVVRLHVTDVPGWHASIDGRPLALDRYSGVMLQARIPGGRHLIVLHYWPTAFSAGLALAAVAAAALLVGPAVLALRRRTRRPPPAEHGPEDPAPRAEPVAAAAPGMRA